ncbi:uncharacterized protein LOC144129766 [Amblyomma americanum]
MEAKQAGLLCDLSAQPASAQASHAGVPCVARPVPTQPLVAPQRLPLAPQPEAIAYLIPSSLGTYQAIPLQHAVRSDGAAYDYHGGGVPVHWSYPQFFYYPAELSAASSAQPPYFLPDVSPEAQRHALSSAPWLRARRQQQPHHHQQLRHAAAHVVTSDALDSAYVANITTTASTSTKRSAPARDKAKAAAAQWQHRAYAAPYHQGAQPVLVAASGQQQQQQQHLMQSLVQQHQLQRR